MSIKKALWGDCIDTLLHSKPVDDWYTEYPKLNYNHFKLPEAYSFDLNEVRHRVHELLDEHQTISVTKNHAGEKFSRYRGLGFYARPDSESPLEDHFVRRDKELGIVYADDLHLNERLPELIENDFTMPTIILDEHFKDVFNKFKSPVSKASLLELRSGGWLGSHVDFPYYRTIRLHASISGCENAYYQVDGETFQVPEDGNWYFIDTGKYHSVWNEGPSHRITLNINLIIKCDPMQLALDNLL